LAMLVALEATEEGSKTIESDTYVSVIMALSVDGAAEKEIFLSRSMVVEHSFTPEIEVFTALVDLAEKGGEKGKVAFKR